MTYHSFTDTRVNRTFEFEGDELARASSKTSQYDQRARWSELELYRTPANNYVLVKTGRTTLPGEIDRVSVFVSETAQGVVESAHNIDPDGAVILTNMARRLLEAAAKVDDDIAAAYYVETIA